jgi:hypothetical protein
MTAAGRAGWCAALMLALPSLALAARPDEDRTRTLAQELATLLDAQKLDSVAARDPATPDQFVAALYFPQAQLLVVSAKYTAPALLNEKILQRNYRDVYIDLNAATDPATKVLVEDLQANGLRSRRNEDEPFDSYTKGRDARLAFDGDWRKQKLTEDNYYRTFDDAAAQYAHMLELLIGELKKTTQ